MAKQRAKKKAVKGEQEYPPTYTFRIQEDNLVSLTDKLKAEKKRRNCSSMSNTIETILMEYLQLK